MEAGLLSAFRDEEHFDGEYNSSSYHNVTNIWENDDSGLKIGLTETLDGILPPSPEHKTDYEQKLDIFKYSNFGTDDNNDCMTPNVEIISIDPNCDYSSPMSNTYVTDNSSDSCNDDNCQSDININYNDNNIEYYLPDIRNDNLLLTKNNNSFIKCKTKKSIYRKSFSLPLSPINNIRCSPPIELSGLSFDDIDITHIANQITFSPIKTNDNTTKFKTPSKNSNNHNIHDYNDDGLTKLIELDKNFDLTSFITNDDCNLLPVTPDKNTNYNSNFVANNCNGSNNKLDDGTVKISKINTRRSCVVKSLKRGYKNYNIQSDSDSDEVDIETICDTKLLVNDEKTMTKEQITKDDVGDPTWIPTPIVKINKKTNRSHSLPQSISGNPQTIRMKIINTGSQLNKNKSLKTVSQGTEKVIQIDHDYCSPTKNVNNNIKKDAIKIKPPTTIFSIMRKQKHKIGLGRGKNISMCTNNYNKNNNSINVEPVDDIIKIEKVTTNLYNHKENLNELKINNNNTNVIKNTNITNDNNEVLNINDNTKSDIMNNNININDKIVCDDIIDKESSITTVIPIKKKLNLQEYKMRRSCVDLNNKNSTLKCKNDNDKDVNIKKENVGGCDEVEDKINISSNINLIRTNENKISSKKQEILNIIKSNDIKHKDPILEARKKILRKQELKKAACIKIIDIDIKKQTSSLQPILPLEEITGVKDNLNLINNNGNNLLQINKINPDYEEITIVSIGCNTDVTIATTIVQLKENECNNEKTFNNNNQNSLKVVNDYNSTTIAAKTTTTTTIVTNEQNKIIKSSFLLSNINDTIKKAQSSGENIKISSNSLISSIQDVVLKKSSPSIGNSIQVSPNIGISPPDGISPGKPETACSKYINIIDDNEVNTDKNIMVANNIKNNNNSKEHGEDKIIMHLRKDRVRPKSYAISIQTDNLSQFPTLIKLNPIRENIYNYNINHSNRSNTNNSKYSRSYSSNTTTTNNNNNNRNYRQRTVSYSSSDSGKNDLNGHSSSSYYNNSSKNNSNNRTSRRSPLNKRTRRYSSRSNRSQNSPPPSSQYNSRRSEDYHHDDRIRRSRSRISDRSTSSINKVKNNHNRSNRSSIGRSRSSVSPDSSRNYNKNHNNERRRRHYSSSISRSSSCSSSRSRSRSKSPCSIKSRCSSNKRYRYRNNERNNNINGNKTIPEERRIVYVGRIEKETSIEDLKKKFISYGPIKQITLHYKEITGVKYGFVTYERAPDAYNAIDCGTRDTKINMYDISFGGRRAFCRTSYSDLDGAATNGLQCPPVYSSLMQNGLSSSASVLQTSRQNHHHHQQQQQQQPQQQDCLTESFDDLLKKVKEKICAKKPRVKI